MPLTSDCTASARFKSSSGMGPGFRTSRTSPQPAARRAAATAAAQRGNTTALNDVPARDRARCAFDATVRNSDFWIEPTDFFRLRYVSATYNIPARLLRGTQSASVTLAGRNLFTSTDYSGLDPESADQSDNTFARREYYQLPTLRSFTLSLKATF